MEVVLNDGTKLECTLNGNNYITTADVSSVDFSDENFKSITVDGVAMTNQKCTNVFTQADGTHIIFRPMTQQEIKMAEIENAMIELADIIGGEE